jgi:hypothetical protein
MGFDLYHSHTVRAIHMISIGIVDSTIKQGWIRENIDSIFNGV